MRTGLAKFPSTMNEERLTVKLTVLADAAKYDVSSASRGSTRTNQIKGLFLSSGIFKNANTTMERLVRVAKELRTAGLPPNFFEQEKIQATTAELFALWRAMGEVSPDPTIGLKLGMDMRVERFAPTAIAAVCSKTFSDAVERMGRYKQLVCPEEIYLRADGKDIAVEFLTLALTGSAVLDVRDPVLLALRQ